MQTADFDYELPEELIAQDPVTPRDHSRLMWLDRAQRRIDHHRFYNLPELLEATGEDWVLVLNRTRVMAARLLGAIPEIGPGRVEVLLLEETRAGVFQAMTKPGAKFQPGRRVEFAGGLNAEVLEVLEDGTRMLRFETSGPELLAAIEEHGQAPIPPYIKNTRATKAQYQTVYARETGSVAAPTAGLHFTPELLETLRTRGVEIAEVTLHVGRGTFLPVKTEDLADHKMHAEKIEMTGETAAQLNTARAAGKKLLAVGTTSVRVLESTCDPQTGRFTPFTGETDIFIYPGYKWRAVDGLLTNFHLPRSTLIMLVSSFADRQFVLHAYQQAVVERYRFYSFGDAMILL